MDCYLDFYPDDQVDVTPSSLLQQTMDMENKEDRDEELYNNFVDGITASKYNTLSIIVYHPEITVTNEHGNSHVLKDVYVRVSFPEMTIHLARTTFTSDEVYSGYIHSHVSKGNFHVMHPFCTGSGPINTLKDHIMDMDSNALEDFKNAITSFIINTERMIRVESLAGGPYVTLESIGKKMESTPMTVYFGHTRVVHTKAFEKFIDFMKYYCSLRLDEFYYDGKNWQLKDTDAEFIRRVTKVALTYKKTSNVSSAHIYQWVYESDGLYYEYNPNGGSYYCTDGGLASWIWKGQYPHIHVIKQDRQVKRTAIVSLSYLSVLYTFLLELINGIYADGNEYKDCIQSRAYKIKDLLINTL